MAGGGLYVLVAYGSQNVLLSGNPDFTYFYTIIKKYSHFSFESATIPLEGPRELFFDEPIQLRAKIQRIGDLLSDLYFTFTLPDIYSKHFSVNSYRTQQYNFKWVRNIGAQIIQSAIFLIGGTQVQEFDSDYLISTAHIDQDETQYNKWQKIVGDIPEIYNPANGKYSGAQSGTLGRTALYPNVIITDSTSTLQTNFPSIPARDITIPLSFWFSQNPSLALPLISLQYHECEVQLILRPIRDLYVLSDPGVPGINVRPGFKINPLNNSSEKLSGNVSYTTDNDPGIFIKNFLTDIGYDIPSLNTWPLNPRIQATYIYLTDDERRTFAVKPLTYIVKQVNKYTFENFTSRQLFDLYTHNPVPRIIVIPRRTDYLRNLNAWTNFTNWWQYPSAPFIEGSNLAQTPTGYSGKLLTGLQEDIIRNLKILCDGNEIQEIKPLSFFNEISSWKYTSGIVPPGLAIYSFALDTSKWMKPSGSLNTSRVKNFQIDIEPWPLVTDSKYAFDFNVYVESINFLVVEGGMGGMKYAI
jgi:hypothetical protein